MSLNPELTMRLLFRTLLILRREPLTCVLTVSLFGRPSTSHVPLCFRFFRTFTSRRDCLDIPRLSARDLPKLHLRQYTDVTAYGDGEFSDADYTCEKTRLFPDHECEVINQVLAASTCEEILKYASLVSSMDLKTASQTVVSMYEILKSVYPPHCHEHVTTLQEVHASSVFQSCLQVLESEIEDLPQVVLFDVFLALGHIIPLDHVILTKCLLKCQEKIPYLSLKELSKFSTIMLKYGSNYLPLLAPVIGKISVLMENLKSEEDIKNLAICLASGITFVSLDCLGRFAKKVEDYILSGKDMEFKTAINCLTVLILTDNQINSIELQQLLISFLVGYVPRLNTAQIRLLFRRISYAKCNTDSIMTAIEQRLNDLLQESRNFSERILLLNCVHQEVSSLKHKFLVDHCIRNHPELYAEIEPFNFSLLMGILYNIFPLQNKELRLHLLKHCCSQNLPMKSLKRISKELLYFKKITGYAMTGESARSFTDVCLHLAEDSVACSDIALLSAFVIAHINSSVPVTFVQRLNNILSQLNIASLSMVVLGVSMASSNFNSLSQTHQKELIDLSSNLSKLCENMLQSSKNLTEYNVMLRNLTELTSSSVSRGQFKQAVLHDSYFDGYCRFLQEENFNIQSIISTCKTISYHRICLPRVLDAIAQCVVERPAVQSVKTVKHALKACFYVNYCPQVQEFLFKCQDKIISESLLFSCHGLLQSALCLGLNSALNDQIIHLIFSKEFLERLEKEISVCSIIQARRIRTALARLNKIVCLDCPEENVPWFHEQYYKALVLNENLFLNEFEKEVYKVLCQILPGKEYIQAKVYSPYYYLISFELLLDKSNSPLLVEHSEQSMKGFEDFQKTSSLGIQRVAVDVLHESQYCRNMPRLTGYALLKKRHLEILGYKLVQVPFFEWNSLQLSNTESRANYLYTKIFQSR